MKKLLAAISLLLALAHPAFGQGQLRAGAVWGNSTAAQAPPQDTLLSPLFDQAFCTTSNALLQRGGSLWACVNNLILSTNSANALTVGPNGSTNPSLNVDASTASAATGLNIKSAAAGGGLAVSTTSSGGSENFKLDAKGSGTMTLGGTSTGNVDIGAGGGGATVHGSFTATGLVTLADLVTGSQDTILGYFSSTSASALAINNCSNALTYSTSTHTFGCNSTAGTGTVTSVTCDGVAITAAGTCPPHVGFVNCSIAQGVSGNNLTISLKDNTGADPSATSPCTVWFRSATATTGSWVQRTVTAATSMTINSGSTLGAVSGVPFKVWVTLWDTGSTAVIGLSIQTTSTKIAPINEAGLLSSTACNACATASTAATFYTTAAQSNRPVVILGWLEWSSGLGSAGVWGGGASILQTLGPGGKKPGDIVQTVTATDATTNNSATTATKVACTGETASITPTMASNPIKAKAYVPWVQGNGTSAQALVQFGRNSSANMIGGTGVGGYNSVTSSNGISAVSLFAFDQPNTTSSTAYGVYVFMATTGSTGSCLSSATAIFIEELEEMMG